MCSFEAVTCNGGAMEGQFEVGRHYWRGGHSRALGSNTLQMQRLWSQGISAA